jgi:RNA polymerase sigma-70 factor (ECF subfamily)
MSTIDTFSNPPKRSVEELILAKQAQEGDHEAFQELVSRSREGCLRMATMILGNRDDAEDEVQNALCKAYTHISLFSHQAAFSTWVTRIVINHCLMHHRKKRRFRLVSFETMGPDGEVFTVSEPTEDDTPERRLGMSEFQTVLRDELRRIPPLLRAPLEMRYFENRSLQEMACLLDISVPAAKSRLHRAHGYLRDRMLRHCGYRGAGTLVRPA